MATARVLVVGGGGGAGNHYGGGGGAGEVEYNASLTITAQAYTVTVGAGGGGGSSDGNGAAGANSVFSTMTALGGGFGAGNSGNGGNGGSGGGGGGTAASAAGTGSAGFNGTGGNASGPGGGGGGAGSVAGTPIGGGTLKGGNGGAGIADASIGDLLALTTSGVAGFIGGGGGGYGQITAGFGGSGGGATANISDNGAGNAATANTGGGGGANQGSGAAGAGGSGLVIVVYTTADFGGHTGGQATGTSGGETWVKFTTVGNSTLTMLSADSAPTVTTQAVTDQAKTTGTGNGNITNLGTQAVTRRGFAYMAGTSGDPTTANSVAYDDNAGFTTGAYTKSITGLTANTAYRVRAYAVNSIGTAYGVTVDYVTSPLSLSGTVRNGGTGVSGAVVRVIRQSTGTYIASTTTDGSGNWSIASALLVASADHHAMVEYTDGGAVKYNAKSLWNLTPG